MVCYLIQETRFEIALDNVVGNICQALADTARHVMGCHFSQEMRVCNALDDVAGNDFQAPPHPAYSACSLPHPHATSDYQTAARWYPAA
jgi:hypothetical protein